MLKQTCIERSVYKSEYGACIRNIPPVRIHNAYNVGYLFERMGDKNHEPITLRPFSRPIYDRLERDHHSYGGHCGRSNRFSGHKRSSHKPNSNTEFSDPAPNTKPNKVRRSPYEDRLADVESQIHTEVESVYNTSAPIKTRNRTTNNVKDNCREACDIYMNSLLSPNDSTSLKSEKLDKCTFNNADLILRRIATQLQGIQRILQCDRKCNSRVTQTRGQYPAVAARPFCATDTCPILHPNGELAENVLYPSNRKKSSINNSCYRVGCCFKSKCCRKKAEKNKFHYPGNSGTSTQQILQCVRNGDYVNDLIRKCIEANTQFCTMGPQYPNTLGSPCAGRPCEICNQIGASKANPVMNKTNQKLQTQRLRALQADADIQVCLVPQTMNQQISAHIQQPIVNAEYLNKLICICNERNIQAFMTKQGNLNELKCSCNESICKCDGKKTESTLNNEGGVSDSYAAVLKTSLNRITNLTLTPFTTFTTEPMNNKKSPLTKNTTELTRQPTKDNELIAVIDKECQYNPSTNQKEAIKIDSLPVQVADYTPAKAEIGPSMNNVELKISENVPCATVVPYQSTEIETIPVEVQNTYTVQELNSDHTSFCTQTDPKKMGNASIFSTKSSKYKRKSYNDNMQPISNDTKSLDASKRSSVETTGTNSNFSEASYNTWEFSPAFHDRCVKVDYSKNMDSLKPLPNTTFTEGDNVSEKRPLEDITILPKLRMVHTATIPIENKSTVPETAPQSVQILQPDNLTINNVPITNIPGRPAQLPTTGVSKQDVEIIAQKSSLLGTNTSRPADANFQIKCYEVIDAVTNTSIILKNDFVLHDACERDTAEIGVQVNIPTIINQGERGIDIQSSLMKHPSSCPKENIDVTTNTIPVIQMEQTIDVQKSLLPNTYNTDDVTRLTSSLNKPTLRPIGDDKIQVLYMPKVFTKNMDSNTTKITQANVSISRQTSLMSRTKESCDKCNKLPAASSKILVNITTNTSSPLRNESSAKSPQKNVCRDGVGALGVCANKTRIPCLMSSPNQKAKIKTSLSPPKTTPTKYDNGKLYDDQVNEYIVAALHYLRPIVDDSPLPRPKRSCIKDKHNTSNDVIGLSVMRTNEKGKELEGKSTQNCPCPSGSAVCSAKIIATHKSDITQRRSLKSGLPAIEENKKGGKSSTSKCKCPTPASRGSNKINCTCNKKHKQS